MTNGTLLVFARAPELGRVKTRLATAVGDAGALRLHQAFLGDSLEAARGAGARVLLAHTGTADFAETQLADTVFPQEGASFGERVDRAFARARALAPSGPLAIVGVDTPHTGPRAWARALVALEDAPAVLGPSPGGGFHLLGFAAEPVPIARAFEGPNEAARVVRLLVAAAKTPALVDFAFDVDLPADLIELVLQLELRSCSETAWCPPRTLSAVRELGLTVVRGGTDTRGVELRVAPTA